MQIAAGDILTFVPLVTERLEEHITAVGTDLAGRPIRVPMYAVDWHQYRAPMDMILDHIEQRTVTATASPDALITVSIA